MVAREVLPDRGSRNLKHHERAPFDVIRNESPVALKSATYSLPAVGGAIFRISVSPPRISAVAAWPPGSSRSFTTGGASSSAWPSRTAIWRRSPVGPYCLPRLPRTFPCAANIGKFAAQPHGLLTGLGLVVMRHSMSATAGPSRPREDEEGECIFKATGSTKNRRKGVAQLKGFRRQLRRTLCTVLTNGTRHR
jgi:hypothetical protein